MKYLIIVLLFTSCITQKKVNSWLNDHPTEAAGYCADHFPPDTTTKTIFQKVDSSGYIEANNRLSGYADSLFLRLDSLQHVLPTSDQPCPPRINLDSLRKEVDREVKKRLIPCVDSVVHINHTVVDRAREKQLQGKLDEKDGVISARDKRISELEAKVKAKNKWIWMFWILLALCGLYVLLKVRKLVPFVLIIGLFPSCLEQVELPQEPPEERDTTLPKTTDTLRISPDTIYSKTQT